MANAMRYDHQQHHQYIPPQQTDLQVLWRDTMHVLWQFLDSEESMKKVDLRKQVEELIYQYICEVPHSRIFVFPNTINVLKSSIEKYDDFSAYKAAIGFEAINQYANNLFTKPWRKEYKTIKMYSGFYKHEIASNLNGAESLFEEMGYRLSDDKQTLVLDGPVCPDRVTSISRDVIAAYVECQVMGEIFAELSNKRITVSWRDIYNFREHNTCMRQSPHEMAVLIQELIQKNHLSRRKGKYRNQMQII
ncbi:protein tamozhennic-like [Uranotaenia lowii]|uniref:protein tamozhennic-like n=1 Tax=Uranotaenia lowii TaxID=190385 RepID=UPI002478734E|nr:protein tamozhennic-like [Uranotaenia lowii]XP_055594990.1 protein tamozhennic-like [Uranotaenia lowii]XP_055594991.1 protein tamozhennic-like [Uranotaenia lowii]